LDGASLCRGEQGNVIGLRARNASQIQGSAKKQRFRHFIQISFLDFLANRIRFRFGWLANVKARVSSDW
jgi:hypothetical protein